MNGQRSGYKMVIKMDTKVLSKVGTKTNTKMDLKIGTKVKTILFFKWSSIFQCYAARYSFAIEGANPTRVTTSNKPRWQKFGLYIFFFLQRKTNTRVILQVYISVYLVSLSDWFIQRNLPLVRSKCSLNRPLKTSF